MDESRLTSTSMNEVLERFKAGKPAALSRGISIVENQRDGFEEFLHAAMQTKLQGRRIGLTGPPGAGKSSLVALLTEFYISQGERVGVLAVDPTSSQTGGALLGDRIRMNDIAIDENVFIRSMATRGSLGGLAATTKEILDLMDCFGFDRLLAETVGVGQTEFEIARAVDTVVVVLVPESGDSIQAMKAGLMEIADIFIVNKADRPGSDKLVKEVRQAIHLRSGHNFKGFAGHHGPVIEVHDTAELNELDDELGWEPLVLKTNALTGEGIQELTQAIESHEEWIQGSGELQKRRKLRTEVRIREVMHRELVNRSIASRTVNKILTKRVEAVLSGHATPYSVAMELVDQFLEKDQ